MASLTFYPETRLKCLGQLAVSRQAKRKQWDKDCKCTKSDAGSVMSERASEGGEGGSRA